MDSHNNSAVLNISGSSPAINDGQEKEQLGMMSMSPHAMDDPAKTSLEGQLVREVLYGTR